MPYLRYSRDKLGYEHTYVLHGSRAGGRPRILYWFRTPPHVIVGRSALDEEATKAIENCNPDLDFDWPKMRRERPKPPSRQAVGPERMRKGDRRAVPASGKGSSRVPEKRPAVEEPEASGEASFPESEKKVATSPKEHPVSVLLGDQALLKLQTAYAALEQQFRDSQITDSLKNDLANRISALNPDDWRAGEEVIFRIEQFESEVAAIQELLGSS